jgi:hypothetical protein
MTDLSKFNKDLVEKMIEDELFRRELLTEPSRAIEKLLGRPAKRVVMLEAQRHLLEQLLTKAAKDTAFRTTLKASPKEAIKSGGFEKQYLKIQEGIRHETDVLAGQDLPCWVWSQCKCFADSCIGIEM